MEYQLFPRLCALAEVGWSSRDSRDFADFERRLYGEHFSRLYNMGIAFRVAPPEVVYDSLSGSLRVRPPHPSAVVRYAVDGAPTSASPVCRGEIVTDAPERMRFATFFGDGLSSIAVGASNIDLYHYIDPEMTVESNFPLLEGNLESLARRGGTGYSDRVLREGDVLTYRMASPVECSRITVSSGAPSSGMFYVTDAYVEYETEDGTVVRAGDLYHGELSPSAPVTQVRIVMTDSNDGYTAVFHGLRIEK